MDKLIRVVNGLFIAIYVIVGLGTSLLFMFRGVNEEIGFHYIEICAPWIVRGLITTLFLHLCLTIYRNKRADL